MSPAFASAVQFGADWRAVADECIAALDAPRAANLGFLYLSDHFAEQAEPILEHLRRATGVAHWVGSVGYGVCGRARAAMDRPGMALLVGAFAPGSFRIFSGRQPLPRSGDPPHFAVVHADPATPDMSELVADMASKVGSGFVTGGLTSARHRALQFADGVLSGGISGVAFAPEVAIATRLSQGCLALPGRYQITAAQDNLIGTLDGRPALSVYKDVIGAELGEDLRRAAQTILVGLTRPGHEGADYTVRNVIGIEPQHGMLAVNEAVTPGHGLLFCRRDGAAAHQDLRRMLRELRDTLAGPPRGALYFACVGRGSNMFDDDDTELELIAETFGELPLAGFFANGEISHDRLYGYTGVLTLFL